MEHVPFLEKARGSLRFEVVEGRQTDRWLVRVDKGDIDVKHKGGNADCVVRADRKVFEDVVGGRVNAFAATLRGQITVDGDPSLLVLLQRLLPGPPDAKGRP
jgi:putative sterol carrier protein